MQVAQVLNNNVITVNEDGEELMILGRGIGFNAKKGDVVNKQLIEKVFYASKNPEEFNQITSIISNIDNKYFQLSNEIIKEIIIRTGRELADTLIVFLAEQLYFLVSHGKLGLHANYSAWSHTRYEYQVEFEVCLNAVVKLNIENNLNLKRDDVAFLVMFIVNRYLDFDDQYFKIFTIHCKAVLHFVDDAFEFDRKSNSINSLITHVNRMIKRVMSGKQINDNGNACKLSALQFVFEFEYCVLTKIEDYFKENTKYQLNDMERMLLLWHLVALVGRKE